MFLEGNGFDFTRLFHLVNNQGDHREIKSSGRRVEMKSQLNSVLEMKVELELIQVNLNGRFRNFDHFSPAGSRRSPKLFLRLEILRKKCDGPYRHIYIRKFIIARIFIAIGQSPKKFVTGEKYLTKQNGK